MYSKNGNQRRGTMTAIKYGKKELDYLKKKDKKLAKIIDELGIIKRTLDANLYSSLLSAIVSQQISGKAAETVWSRLENLAGEVTPENISKLTIEDIQKCGMSFKKVDNIKNATEKVLSGELDIENLHKLSDEEICAELSKLNGIGIWTAEMLLIFSMGRMDILSYGDFGIKKGIQLLHKLDKIDKKAFNKYKKLYSPYGTIASFYFWAIANGECKSLL